MLCGCIFVVGFGCSNAIQSPPASTRAPANQQWEYLFINGDDNGFNGISKKDLDGDGKMDSYTIDSWNKLGKEGWEFVCMDQGLATLKRPLN